MGRLQRTGCLMMAGLLTIFLFCGCERGVVSQKEENTGSQNMETVDTIPETTEFLDNGPKITPGWQLNAKDKVKFTWYINFSWFTTTWGENLISQAITDETGVDIQFIAPAGTEAERLNSMISSDTLPDIITLGWWESQVNEMIDKDMVYALNELADQYDLYFYEVTDETTRNWYKNADGNLYLYPNSSYTPDDYEIYDNIPSNQTFLVRKDIYEAIGSPDMTTPEGFAAAVKAAAEVFPEVNGEPLIPIGVHEFNDTGCASFDQYLCNFLAVPYEKDGVFYDRYTDAEYIRWLKVFRQLGEEGYLADDIFVDKRAQMEEKIAQGRYFCMIYQYTDMEDQQKFLYATEPDKIYVAIDGPKNANGDAHTLPGTAINGWTVTLISKKCENPDRAIQFLSYLLSEYGQKRTYLGVEGVTYEMQDGMPVIRPEVLEVLYRDRIEYDQLYGADNTYWMLQDIAMQKAWEPEPEEPIAQLKKWTYPYVVYVGQYECSFRSDSEAANAKLRIDHEWSDTLPRLLLASTEEEFDQILEDFIEKRADYGFDLLQRESTRQMNEAKEKLGIDKDR